jgi:pimeloyl-ACP methyl ester carboxylesterase
MLAGVSIAIDIWLLRARTLARTVHMTGLIRVMWLGFGINTASGLALLLAYPAKALTNPVFYAKLALVAAGVYAIARINREAFPHGEAAAGSVVNAAAKRWAAGSLLFWAGTIATGRLLAYTHHVLFATQLP